MKYKTTLCAALLAISSAHAATVALHLPEAYRSSLNPDGYPWSAYWYIDNGTNTIEIGHSEDPAIVELGPGLYEVTGHGSYESEFAAIIQVEDKPGMQCFTTIAIDNMSDEGPSKPQGITYAGACQDAGATTNSEYINTGGYSNPAASADPLPEGQNTDWCYTQPYCTMIFDGKPYAYPYGWRIVTIYYEEAPYGGVEDTPSIGFERQSDGALAGANLRPLMMAESCLEELPNGDMCFYPSERQPINEQERRIMSGYPLH